jgi:triacylglycerol lipase
VRLVLLHALARSANSMRSMASFLSRQGHEVHVIEYATTHTRLMDIANNVGGQLERRGLFTGGADIGFVAHSMGGLVFRALGKVGPTFRCGRSVLVGSPIRGSIIAEHCSDWPIMKVLYGPAIADIAPRRVADLPPPPGPFATIAGTRRTRLLPASFILDRLAPGQRSDSTVLVEETRHSLEADHIEVAATHYMLPSTLEVQRQIALFLEHGRFDHGDSHEARPRSTRAR